MIYANNAGTSWPKPPGVAEAVAAALEDGPRRSEEIFELARAAVCESLGIARPDRFLFTSSCTSAIAVALDDLPWQAGDCIVTSSLEHHALGRPVQKLVENRGVRHVASPYAPGRPLDLDFVAGELRNGGVRLVAVSQASNVTGEVLPVREAAKLAHEHGALCLVDAAQTFGVLPVDVVDLGADLLVFAGHKGPLGPQGIGGLWAAPHVELESPQAACSIERGPSACSGFPGYCDVGSVNVAAAAGLEAGLRWRLRHLRGPDGGRPREMARRLVSALRERSGCTVFGGAEAERTATLSIRLDALPVAEAERYFASRGIVVRAAEHCAPWALEAIGAPEGTIRISFGPHNDTRDVDAILDAIDT